MTTTIKVSGELRDRLKAQASREGRTLGVHLSYLADLADRNARLESLRAAIASTPAPAAASHAVESGEWERAELSDAMGSA